MKINIKTCLATIAALMMVATAAKAAENRIDVDLNEVRVNVTMHPDHYRNLVQRFEAADTTMRPDEAATVYYGYSYTFDYDPRIQYSEVEKLVDEKKYEEAYTQVKSLLRNDPASLDLLELGIESARHSSQEDAIDNLFNWRVRYSMLVNTIMTTGRGIVPESPFKVIRDADSMHLLKKIFLVNNIIDRTTVGNNIDAIKFRMDGNFRDFILYFDNRREKEFMTTAN